MTENKTEEWSDAAYLGWLALDGWEYGSAGGVLGARNTRRGMLVYLTSIRVVTTTLISPWHRTWYPDDTFHDAVRLRLAKAAYQAVVEGEDEPCGDD